MLYNVTNQLKPTRNLIPLNLEKVFYIVIHHAESKNCTWEDINKWHKDNGWNCAGYNEFIRKNGDVYIMRGDNIGAQCAGYNSCSYGICLEGNYDIENSVTKEQFNALVDRCKINIKRFVNFKTIKQHKDLYDTVCPGKYFPFNNLISSVNIYDEFKMAIEKLQDKGIINSPDYWNQNAKEGLTCKGEYVQTLIKNIAKVI